MRKFNPLIRYISKFLSFQVRHVPKKGGRNDFCCFPATLRIFSRFFQSFTLQRRVHIETFLLKMLLQARRNLFSGATSPFKPRRAKISSPKTRSYYSVRQCDYSALKAALFHFRLSIISFSMPKQPTASHWKMKYRNKKPDLHTPDF